jgi:uncharacterized protein (TIGR03435 family)
MIRGNAGLAAVLVASSSALPATIVARQDAATEQPVRFEVASVKPTQLGPTAYLIAFRDGRYTAHYVTLRRLIQSAYATIGGPLLDTQVIGGPEWLGESRFDIDAIAPGTPNSSNGTIPLALHPMLRNLLEERFGLKVHVETRDVPMFAIVLARSDGSLGPKLRRRTTPCFPAPVGMLPKADGRTCGARTGLGMLNATGITVPTLANGLSQVVPEIANRIVVDRTGLTGTFDVDLHWAPDDASVRAVQGAFSTAPLNGTTPPFFAALQEQLGLKIESIRGPVKVVVVESASAPTPN